jgi:hypothetical protein
VARWLGELGREDLCVREDLKIGEDELFRVYVGYSSRKAFKTFRDYPVVSID